MIVKYRNLGAWNFVDGVVKLTRKSIGIEMAVKKFDSEVPVTPDSTICTEAKVFREVMNDPDLSWACALNCHQENIVTLDSGFWESDSIATGLLLHLGNGEYMIVLTNQEAYLLNEKGQTIERIA